MVTRNEDATADAGRGAERRRHPRAPADWTVEIALEDGVHRARLRDVSRIGMCFHLERPIPMMTVLRIGLDLPATDGKRRVTGSGAVVRCQRISPALEHYEVAIFLHEMGDEDRDALDRHVGEDPALGAR
jgi:hypothetical protein